MNRARRSPIFNKKDSCVVLNGLDENIFHFYNSANELRNKHGLSSEKIIFHATPNFSDSPEHIKGGYYVIEMAKKLKEDNVKFFVAGPYINGIDVPENIVLLGKITDQRVLAQYYAMADVTLLTSKKETFSMVTAESLCCGTPVVGFKAGAPEQIALEDYSDFSEYGDVDTLTYKIREWLQKEIDKVAISERAIKKYGKNVMCESYLEIYKKLCEK
jgi:glycosyltransferase involved in cell wall biosynthesis